MTSSGRLQDRLVPVHTNTYQYIVLHTSMYLYVPVCTGMYHLENPVLTCTVICRPVRMV